MADSEPSLIHPAVPGLMPQIKWKGQIKAVRRKPGLSKVDPDGLWDFRNLGGMIKVNTSD